MLTFCTMIFFFLPDPLSGDSPEKALALVAVRGRGGGPEHEVVRGGARDGIDQGL